MLIVPGINCQDADCVATKFAQVREIFAGVSASQKIVHIDVADGGFTDGYATWRSPADLVALCADPSIRIEVHLMVNEPERIIEQWLNAGAQRVIVHVEATDVIPALVGTCAGLNKELMLSLRPDTPVSRVLPYLASVLGCQLLAVKPGLSGQLFDRGTLDKIRAIKAASPRTFVEVDGGVNLEVARLVATAGADSAVVASAIWNSADAIATYRALTAI